MKLAEMVGLNEQFPVVGETNTKHCGVTQQVSSERSCVLANDSNGVRNLVEPFSDGVKVPKGHQFPLVENDNLFGDAFNFIQDMAAHQHRSTEFTEFTYHVHDGGSCQWVAPLEGFVEDDEVGVIDKCMCDFGSLSHAFGKASNLLVGHIPQAHEIQHSNRFFFGFAPCHPVQAGEGAIK